MCQRTWKRCCNTSTDDEAWEMTSGDGWSERRTSTKTRNDTSLRSLSYTCPPVRRQQNWQQDVAESLRRRHDDGQRENHACSHSPCVADCLLFVHEITMDKLHSRYSQLIVPLWLWGNVCGLAFVDFIAKSWRLVVNGNWCVPIFTNIDSQSIWVNSADNVQSDSESLTDWTVRCSSIAAVCACMCCINLSDYFAVISPRHAPHSSLLQGCDLVKIWLLSDRLAYRQA